MARAAETAYQRYAATATSAQQSATERAFAAEQRRVNALLTRGPSAYSSYAPTGPTERKRVLSEAKDKGHEAMKAAIEKSKDMGAEDRARIGAQRDLTKATEAEIRKRVQAERDAAAQSKAEYDQRLEQERKITTQRREAAKVVWGAGKNAVLNATSVTGRALSMVANAAPGGGFSVEDSLRREVAFRGRASQIAATTNTGIGEKELQASAKTVAIQNGLDPEEVLKGYEAVKKLDDSSLPVAIKAMPKMAQLASATGTNLGELGGTAAGITAAHPEYFGDKSISDDEKAKYLNSQLRIFAQQGISGGIEIEDFAKYSSRLTAGAGLFGGDREHNEAMLGAAAQIARQRGGAASPAEATLAAQRFATDLQKKADKLRAMSVNVTNKDGSLRDLEGVTTDLLKNRRTLGRRVNRV